MQTNPSVSIIIPVYNTELYLQKCLDSIINQSFTNIEIIAIDDHSTDNSLNILKSYQQRDKRINILENYGRGLSQARNFGIENSLGKYIMFVDSDDWIKEDMVETMYNKAESENADMVMSTYIREFKNCSKEKVFNLPEISIYVNETIKSDLLRKLVGPVKEELRNPEYVDALGTAWAKLYRHDVIKDNNIKFIDSKKIGPSEDTLFNIYTFNKLSKVIFINKPMYHYRRTNSESITAKYNPKLKEQRKFFFRYIRDFLDENKFESIFYEALDNRICTSVLGFGLMECCPNNKVSHMSKIKNIKSILNEDYIKKAYKELNLRYFSIHWRLFYLFNKKRIPTCSYIMLNIIEFLRKRI